MEKIYLSKITNARDLGGTAAAEGKKIKANMLIRSDALFELNEEDRRILCDGHKLKTIIDLRTATECWEKPDAAIEGVEHVEIPIFPEEIVGISRGKKLQDSITTQMLPDMRENYRLMVKNASARANFASVIRRVMAQDEGAILWHCTAGKDRCGMTSVLIEHILGVDMETICADYIRTNEAATPVAEHFSKYVLAQTGNQAMADRVYDAFIANMEFLDAAFEQMELLYGGIDGFVENGLGITKEEINSFRNKVLE